MERATFVAIWVVAILALARVGTPSARLTASLTVVGLYVVLRAVNKRSGTTTSQKLSRGAATRLMRSLKRDRDQGATLVEFALILPIIVILVMGIAEFSLAFKDLLTIRHASVTGARGGATAANDITADIQVLTAIEEVLAGAGLRSLDSVRVSNPDPPFQSTTYIYTGDPTCAWTPCPDPYAGPELYDPPYQPPDYLPEGRDVTVPEPGRLKVSITLTHQWVTGLFADTSTWTADTIMRIEPRLFE